MALSIRVLGRPFVINGAADCTPTRPQSLHLLGLLASDPFAWVSADVLSHDLRSAALTQATRRLRKEIGQETIAYQGRTYRLDPDYCTIDLATWTELTERAEAASREGDHEHAVSLYGDARRLWTGPAFDGISKSLILDDASERLRQRRIKVEVQQARLLQKTGDPEACELFGGLVREEPLREDLAIGLIEALCEFDRRVDASREAAAFRTRLIETGMEATDGFVEAEGRVHSPGSGRRSETEARPESHASRLRPAQDLPGIIAAAATACVSGERPPMFRLSTPHGFDISHALWVAIETLRDGHHVAVSRPPATGPYSIRRALPSEPVELGAGRTDEQYETLNRWQTHGAADPTVLVVTDSDQLDHWSQSLLLRLAEEPAAIGLCVITVGPAPEFPADEAPDPHALARLGRDEIADLVTQRLGSQIDPGGIDLVTEQLVRETRGERLAVEHQITLLFSLTNALPDDASTPDQLANLLSLPSGTRDMLARSACLGRQFDLVLLAATIGREPSDVLGVLSPAISAGFLEGPDTAGRWRFALHATYELALGLSDAAEQMAVQLGAGRILADRPGRRHEAAQLMERSLAIGDPSELGKVLALAGEEVAAAGAYREASELFRKAMAFAPSAQVEASRALRHAEMLELCGDHTEASAALDQVLDLAIELDDSALLAAAALHGSGRGSRIGGLVDRRRRLAIAHGRITEDHPDSDAVTVEYAIELFSARCPLSVELDERLHEIAEKPDSQVRAPAARVRLVREEIMVGAEIEMARNVAKLVLESRELPAAAATACFATAIHVALSAGHFLDAEHWIAELRALGEKTGTPRAKWQSRVYAAALSGAQGSTGLSNEVAKDALDLGMSLQLDDAMATYAFHLAEPAMVGCALDKYLPVLEGAEGRYDFPIWYGLRGLAHLDAGHTEEASEMINRILTGLDDGTDFFRCGTLATLALLATRLSDTPALLAAEAALSARRNRFIFVGYGGPCFGPLAAYQALVAGALDRHDEKVEFELEAQRVCREVGARTWTIG